MGHRLARAIAAGTLGCALAASAPSAARGPFDPADFLKRYAGFSNHDIARVASGTAVAKSISADGDEVAVAGAVFMAIPRAQYFEKFKDIAAFKRAPGVLAIGRFSSPPVAADMKGFTLSKGDAEELRRCRPGDCDIRMDRAGIEKIAATDPNGGETTAAASAKLREHLASYAAEYLQRGDAALIVYGDRHKPRPLAADLRLILQRSPYFERELAALKQDVAAFGGLAESRNDHFVYWSLERIAGTPVLSLTHAIIATTPADGLTAAATRQIYASHFFHASLGLTLVADTNGPKGAGVTVIYINRSRVDAFSGILGPVKRVPVRARARTMTERLLNGLRAKLEAQ